MHCTHGSQPRNDRQLFCILGKDVFPVYVVGSLARDGSFWIVKIGEPEMEKQRQIQVAIRCDSYQVPCLYLILYTVES